MPHEPTPHQLRCTERSPRTQVPAYDEECNGRLAIGAPPGSQWQQSYSYSDGARWTLGSRLERLLRNIEDLASEAEQGDQEQEHRAAEQRRRWYATVAQARERLIEQHRATALAAQVEGWRRAAEIRSFCAAARARAGEDLPAAEEEWLRWVESTRRASTPCTPRSGRHQIRLPIATRCATCCPTISTLTLGRSMRRADGWPLRNRGAATHPELVVPRAQRSYAPSTRLRPVGRTSLLLVLPDHQENEWGLRCRRGRSIRGLDGWVTLHRLRSVSVMRAGKPVVSGRSVSACSGPDAGRVGGGSCRL